MVDVYSIHIAFNLGHIKHLPIQQNPYLNAWISRLGQLFGGIPPTLSQVQKYVGVDLNEADWGGGGDKTLPSRKLTWQWKVTIFGDTSSNGGFLILMLVFRDVRIVCLLFVHYILYIGVVLVCALFVLVQNPWKCACETKHFKKCLNL